MDEFWRVVMLSESDEVSGSDKRGFEEIDILAELLELLSLSYLSTLSAQQLRTRVLPHV
jgi:hypothetical protein